ncbi:sugar-binding transcriptional regulator [Tranquillimonas rosea]|uniref:sugar-binding transcriptional regulator n=1 Tax=Tranquillimonas rosea TaxID=641238 RepID=UPI003BAA0FBA
MPRPARDLATLLKVARMRYERNLTQTEIADSLGVSAATVSRYLSEASERGLIEIRVVESAYRDFDLERALRSRFDLDEAIAVRCRGTAAETLRILGSAAARAIVDRIEDGSVVGVSNGQSVAHVAAELSPLAARDADVVTLIGGVGRAEEDSHTGRICRRFADTLKGRARILPLPALLDSEEQAAVLRGTEAFRVLERLYAALDIAVVGIGTLSPQSSTVQDGLFTEAQLAQVISEGGAGTICARFMDAEGLPVSAAFEARTISITFDELRRVPCRFGVAMGPEKVDAIGAAVRGGLVNALATDAETAARLLAAAAE